MRLHRRSSASTTCPFCRDEVVEGPECPRCLARYHSTCARDLGTCAALACPGRIAGPPRFAPRSAPRPSRPSWTLRFVLAAAALWIGAALMPSPLVSAKGGNETVAIGVLRAAVEVDRERGHDLAWLVTAAPGRFPQELVIAVAKCRPHVVAGYAFDAPAGPRWAIRATPVSPGRSGDRSFAVGLDGRVVYRSAGSFPLGPDGSFPADALPVGR